MKIIKRNQLIILVISLMLITAGYLNFTTDNNVIPTSYLTAELGDATLVSSNAVIEENVVETNIEEENVTNDVENNEIIDENITEIVANIETDDAYFTTSKLERENMYSQMLETYQQIYNNSETSADQKTSALTEIANINKIRNALMIAENLISAKGFENVVIFVNENSVSVVVGEQELETEKIAQIQNIVSRELNVDASIIHISIK